MLILLAWEVYLGEHGYRLRCGKVFPPWLRTRGMYCWPVPCSLGSDTVRYPRDPRVLQAPIGYRESLLHLGESLTLAALETDPEVESSLWKVYLGELPMKYTCKGVREAVLGRGRSWPGTWSLIWRGSSELSQTGARELLVPFGSRNIQSLASGHLLVPGSSLRQRGSQCRGTAMTFLAAGDECIEKGSP